MQLLPYYLGFGSERSLPKVQAALAGMGIEIDVRTLKKYSAQFGWVAKAQEFDRARLEVQGSMPVIQDAIASDARHAALGRQLQQEAVLGLLKRQTDQNHDYSGTEIARMAREGINIERLASGQATTIVEIMQDAYHGLVEQLTPSFMQAMDRQAAFLASLGLTETQITDAQSRAMESFVADIDRMIQLHFVRSGIIETTFVESSGGEE